VPSANARLVWTWLTGVAFGTWSQRTDCGGGCTSASVASVNAPPTPIPVAATCTGAAPAQPNALARVIVRAGGVVGIGIGPPGPDITVSEGHGALPTSGRSMS
jgi:hypothetical protein